ncbi:hypothetical protein Ddye_027666 [Dipteronia dyeriana]|uniref:Uncharacterized protein n=1 Tax=Dipteronia dyeriana TaxID=168575 RepID=A0AAD9WQQ6_9ROSI|nr:hypothetical protein Ddye_027666 [Dipteronia dyeriana]
MPMSIAQKIEKLQQSFFWRDGCEKRKMHLFKWETLCQSKCNGGLDIGLILVKNNGLLARWAWRFGKKDSPLWKRVICAKYGVSVSSLKWDWNGAPSYSFFVKAVGSLFEEGSKSALILKDGLRVVMRRGDKARMLTDIVVDDMSLKEAVLEISLLLVTNHVL